MSDIKKNTYHTLNESNAMATKYHMNQTMDDDHIKTLAWQGWAEEERNFVLEMQHPFAELVVSGKKTIETRAYPLPDALLNVKIEILQSSKGQDGVSALPSTFPLQETTKVRRIGWVTFNMCIEYKSKEEFESDAGKHLVDPNSKYGWNDERSMFGWVIHNFQKEDAKNEEGSIAVRRMRSLFEIITG